MADNSVEIDEIEVSGATAYTVRVVENGELSIKAHCNSLVKAKNIANSEATRLSVRIIRRKAPKEPVQPAQGEGGIIDNNEM